MGFVFADHVVKTSSDGTSYNLNEDSLYSFNLKVENTDSLTTANITQIDITLPSIFAFSEGSNGTDSVGEFSTNNNVLSWIKTNSFVINATETKYFWFNATASTPGNYNLTIASTNTSGVFYSNISVVINDTTSPLIDFDVGTPNDGINVSRNWIYVNASVSDASTFNVTFTLINSTGNIQNQTTFTDGTRHINWTGLSEGTYRYNVSSMDVKGYENKTSARTIRLDTTKPRVTIDYPSNTTYTSSNSVSIEIDLNEYGYCEYTRNNWETNYSLSSTNNLTFTGTASSLSNTYYIIRAGCRDAAGNMNNTEFVYFSVSYSSDDDEDSDSDSSSSAEDKNIESYWKNTFLYNDKNLDLKGAFTKELRLKERVAIKFEDARHYIGVIELSSSSVLINVSSNPQQGRFSVGDSKKFEVSSDSYYDISIKLNSIDVIGGVKYANITITPIHEKKETGGSDNALVTYSNSTKDETINNTASSNASEITDWMSSKNKIILIVVIVVVLLAAALIIWKRKSFYKKFGYKKKLFDFKKIFNFKKFKRKK